MNKQLNLKVAVLIPALIIASIIAAPFVYAAVEPHIILVMDTAQTTNPFTIQDNSANDVFSINEDGDIEQESNTYVYHVASEDILFVNATHVFGTDPLVLVAVKFTPKVQNDGNVGFPHYDFRVSAESIQDIGTSSIQIIAERSEDDVSWGNYAFCSQTNPTWGLNCALNVDGYNNGDPDIYWRVVAINGDGATSGAIAHYDVRMAITVPPGWVVDPAWTG